VLRGGGDKPGVRGDADAGAREGVFRPLNGGTGRGLSRPWRRCALGGRTAASPRGAVPEDLDSGVAVLATGVAGLLVPSVKRSGDHLILISPLAGPAALRGWSTHDAEEPPVSGSGEPCTYNTT
jgi:hypothetical protein